ncbi:MAG: hypothetical protein OXI53_12000 [Nitrospira sp.]|nr:hypothetical protein [Nitrospira sp.]MDE0406019.1 hypothetical protein [Nitrospira sp.]
MVTEGCLVSLELALAEASNILRRLERTGRISRVEAESTHGDLLRLDVELFPFAPFAEGIYPFKLTEGYRCRLASKAVGNCSDWFCSSTVAHFQQIPHAGYGHATFFRQRKATPTNHRASLSRRQRKH